MACTSPLKAYKAPGGGISFSPRFGYFDRHLELPCGQCMSCRLAKVRDWGIRAVHEAQMHEKNSFITLTYNEQNLPEDNSVDVRHWQLFAKRLRKQYGTFRFLHCGEYGDENKRPHYHACLFGIDFSDARYVLKQDDKNILWTSPILEKVWGMGYCTIGPLTYDTAAYVARYTLKKMGGERAKQQYERVDADTGEVTVVRPEYATMSRRKGLGQTWFEKYSNEIYPEDIVVMKGKKFRPPKYYDKLLEKKNPKQWEKIKVKRQTVTKQKSGEETYERRQDRDKVIKAKTSLTKKIL